jgi:hypothetical protein
MMSSTPKHGIGDDASYLREQAQRCVRLARECPHLPTSQELEAIGIDLMERAAELDDLLDVPPGNDRAHRQQ